MVADVRNAGIRSGSPRLLMLAGLPGSGKSRFAREVTARCPFVVVESDRVRKALVAKPQYTAGEHSRVFRACHRLMDEFLGQGYPVLFDATNTGQRNRRPVYSIAEKRGAPLAIAVMTAPPEVVQKRLLDREAGLDQSTWSEAGWEIYTRMAPAWQKVSRPHILVDTSCNIQPALQRVLDWAGTE